MNLLISLVFFLYLINHLTFKTLAISWLVCFWLICILKVIQETKKNLKQNGRDE